MERQLNDQQLVRRQKAEELKQKGINPFGNAFKLTSNSKKIKEAFVPITLCSLDYYLIWWNLSRITQTTMTANWVGTGTVTRINPDGTRSR